MPGFTHDIVVDVIDRDELGLVLGKAAAGDNGMDMKIGFKIIAEGMKDKDHADSQGLFLREDIVNDFGGRIEQEFLAARVVDEEGPELIRNGQYNMPMVAVKEFCGHGLGPDVSMFFAAAGAEFAFTAKADNFCFTAMRANESSEAAVCGAAGKHFFGLMEDVLGKLIPVESLEENPIIVTFEDRFEGQFSAHDDNIISEM